MKNVHMILDEGGDWLGIYVDGTLLVQGHETSWGARKILECLEDELNINFEVTYQCLEDGLFENLEKQLRTGGSDEV